MAKNKDNARGGYQNQGRASNQMLFFDFSKGLYLLDTPRHTGEQLKSLALKGGRNVWSEKSSLVPQHGYIKKAQIPREEYITGVSDTASANSSVFITTLEGHVYYYSAFEGLKKFKTELPAYDQPLLCVRGTDLIIATQANIGYVYGGYYEDSDVINITPATAVQKEFGFYRVVMPQELNEYYWIGKQIDVNGDRKGIVLSSEVYDEKAAVIVNLVDTIDEDYDPPIEGQKVSIGFLQAYQWMVYREGIVEDVKLLNGTNNEYKISIRMIDEIDREVVKAGESVDLSFRSPISGDLQYDYMNVGSVIDREDGTYCRVDFRLESGEEIDDGTEVVLGERAIIPMNWEYVEKDTVRIEKDESGQEVEVVVKPGERTQLYPQLISFCNNRLFIEDITGNIYYSQIGVINIFEEKFGAGFFGGFYNDSSKTLSIEDYMGGFLICKQNGIYQGSIGEVVDISKISQAGQEYKGDHVIVRDMVYAFDVNTGALINAAKVNVFGSLVAGDTVVTSEYLASQDAGISSSERKLTYNAESEVFILYYGTNFQSGLVLTSAGTLFPRELDKPVKDFKGFNQGVLFVGADNTINQDFKKHSIMPNLTAIAEFEPIALRSNKMIQSAIIEISELNGVEFDLTAGNTLTSTQKVKPVELGVMSNQNYLAPMLYSNEFELVDSFELTSQWVDKKSRLVRMMAPMSGREGVQLRFEFPANAAFCMSAINLPDFSQGE